MDPGLQAKFIYKCSSNPYYAKVNSTDKSTRFCPGGIKKT